jgi:hypothetical protein
MDTNTDSKRPSLVDSKDHEENVEEEKNGYVVFMIKYPRISWEIRWW